MDKRKGGFNKHKGGLSFVDHIPKFLQGLEEERPGSRVLDDIDGYGKRKGDVILFDDENNGPDREGEEGEDEKLARYEEEDRKGEEEALERALKEERDRKEYEQLLEEEKMKEMDDEERKLYLIKQKMKKLDEEEKMMMAIKKNEQVRERCEELLIDRNKLQFSLQKQKRKPGLGKKRDGEEKNKKDGNDSNDAPKPPKSKKAKLNKSLLSFDDDDF